MFERLALVKNSPQQVLDAGCGAGADLAQLQKAYPAAQVLGVDAVPAMLAAAAALPRRRAPSSAVCCRPRAASTCCAATSGSCRWARTRSTSYGRTWRLHWHPQPDRVFAEWRRVLRVDGLLMFSNFGPDTFRELRNAFAAMDETPHTLPFVDMHDFGDQLVEAGFTTPVMDMERSRSPTTRRRRCWPTCAPSAAIRWPRAAAGWSGARPGSACSMRWKASAARTASWGLTFEVIYGHAFRPAPKVTAAGEAIVRFQPRPQPPRPECRKALLPQCIMQHPCR
jgi:malonyl-CoA O-methyltransferase